MFRLICVVLFWGCFLSTVLELTECAELNITVEEGMTIIINSTSDCKVCISQNCQSSVILKTDTLLHFNCSQPENVITVDIIRDIVFTEQMTESNIQPKEYPAFEKFNRTFTWIVTSGYPFRKFYLNFTSMGLQQIRETDSCPDKHIYTFTSLKDIVGSFCQKGDIVKVGISSTGKMSMKVSGGQLLDTKLIIVSVTILMNTLTYVQVVSQDKSSTMELFSLNYPNSVRSSSMMIWSFIVPPSYYTSVVVLNYTLPTCGVPLFQYAWIGQRSLVKYVNESQPILEPGSFDLSLANCEEIQPKPPQSGLTVHIQISITKKMRGQCNGDLPLNEILQIHVKRKDPKSNCLLKYGSLMTDTVTITSGSRYDLYFFDCNKKELELTVNQTINCTNWQNCTSTPFPLNFCYEQPCIPGVLKTMTWHIHGPDNSSVELLSPTGGLCYSLPEQKCNSNFLLDVSHDNSGIAVGQFCPNGPIQNININKSKIDVSCTAISDRGQAISPIINYIFRKEISEHYIFTVEPKCNNPALLATPAWPSGMTQSHTVSWIVKLDPQFTGKLEFKNVSKPKCKEMHTSITVQSIRSKMMLYSIKEDEKIKDLRVSESFYLNMTNCESTTEDLRAMMQITVVNNTNYLLSIILSVVGIVVVIITSVVVCFVIRKKKRNKASPVSIYNPGNHDILPGLRIPQTWEEDSHIYVYIDESQVYSDLPRLDNINKGSIKDDSIPPLPERAVITDPTTNVDNLIDNELYGCNQG